MDDSNVSIIIPAFNEAEGIGPVLQGLKKGLPRAEIIVIDDASTDQTGEIAAASGAQVIRHDHNRGYGAGLKSGIRASTRPYVLCCDADGQHTPEDVQRMIEAANGFDMVVGARNQDSHQPLIRRPGKFILRWFANTLAGVIIPDLNSGLRIFKRETILKYLHLMPNGFSFSTTSTFAMLKSNRRMKWIPITVKRRVGKSTVRQLKHGPQTLMLLLRLAVLFEPLKVFLSVAGFMFVLSILSLAIDLFSAGGIMQGGGLADTTVLLSIATIIVFMSGLLCDQVSALRREQHE